VRECERASRKQIFASTHMRRLSPGTSMDREINDLSVPMFANQYNINPWDVADDVSCAEFICVRNNGHRRGGFNCNVCNICLKSPTFEHSNNLVFSGVDIDLDATFREFNRILSKYTRQAMWMIRGGSLMTAAGIIFILIHTVESANSENLDSSLKIWIVGIIAVVGGIILGTGGRRLLFGAMSTARSPLQVYADSLNARGLGISWDVAMHGTFRRNLKIVANRQLQGVVSVPAGPVAAAIAVAVPTTDATAAIAVAVPTTDATAAIAVALPTTDATAAIAVALPTTDATAASTVAVPLSVASANASAAASASRSSSLVEQITELKALYDSGALTEQEFSDAKSKVLS